MSGFPYGYIPSLDEHMNDRNNKLQGKQMQNMEICGRQPGI